MSLGRRKLYGASAHENPYPTNRRIKQRMDEPALGRSLRVRYSAEEVVKLWRLGESRNVTLAQLWRGETVGVCCTGRRKKGTVNSLGALTGGQAYSSRRRRVSKPFIISGWQVAADANLASSMYPDQLLYPGPTRYRRWWIGSTTPSAAPIRSSGQRELNRTILALYRLLPADRGGCGGRRFLAAS